MIRHSSGQGDGGPLTTNSAEALRSPLVTDTAYVRTSSNHRSTEISWLVSPELHSNKYSPVPPDTAARSVVGLVSSPSIASWIGGAWGAKDHSWATRESPSMEVPPSETVYAVEESSAIGLPSIARSNSTLTTLSGDRWSPVGVALTTTGAGHVVKPSENGSSPSCPWTSVTPSRTATVYVVAFSHRSAAFTTTSVPPPLVLLVIVVTSTGGSTLSHSSCQMISSLNSRTIEVEVGTLPETSSAVGMVWAATTRGSVIVSNVRSSSFSAMVKDGLLTFDTITLPR